MSDKEKIIKFEKPHIRVAIAWLIRSMAQLANMDAPPECIGDLSMVLAVLHKCYESAPDAPKG